ncbi:MAG: guanine deaminase [Spongiibacteraceae bacterium]|nr:guanine deaminase [Spongiibacteraceae bacterium]
MSSSHSLTAYRAEILHFLADPDKVNLEQSYQYFEDGLLVVDNISGCVFQVGPAQDLLAVLQDSTVVEDYRGHLLMPGFVDTHVHFPQIEMMAAYGETLLSWLNNYTYPIEKKFSNPVYARAIAERFLDELLRAGTTSALVFATVHKASVDAFFEACELRNLRMITGKVMMDRNAPDDLLDTPESAFNDSQALIDKWHNRGRLRYAVSPRFAPTSTAQQLQKAGELLQKNPDVYLHTHLCESAEEVDWVKSLYPECEGYLDTYDQAGLLGRRSVFAHCLHLTGKEWCRLEETQSNIAFCPTSNLFLGSGLFPLSRAVDHNIRVGLATDVGAGSSLSMLQTLNEAYKVLRLQNDTLSPFKGFYLATLGGAQVLDMDDVIGNFQVGKEADFILIDKSATPLLNFRLKHCKDLFEQLFVLSMLGDDRLIKATYAAGKKVHQR